MKVFTFFKDERPQNKVLLIFKNVALSRNIVAYTKKPRIVTSLF